MIREQHPGLPILAFLTSPMAKLAGTGNKPGQTQAARFKEVGIEALVIKSEKARTMVQKLCVTRDAVKSISADLVEYLRP